MLAAGQTKPDRAHPLDDLLNTGIANTGSAGVPARTERAARISFTGMLLNSADPSTNLLGARASPPALSAERELFTGMLLDSADPSNQFTGSAGVPARTERVTRTLHTNAFFIR